uniref:Uncharacterized protein n=1 Tax=Burkholderia sp. M701 TaxID=326454 RepID=V5YNR7_9BURK|nr:hypothetical protein [Burkholderia sp. M701]
MRISSTPVSPSRSFSRSAAGNLTTPSAPSRRTTQIPWCQPSSPDAASSPESICGLLPTPPQEAHRTSVRTSCAFARTASSTRGHSNALVMSFVPTVDALVALVARASAGRTVHNARHVVFENFPLTSLPFSRSFLDLARLAFVAQFVGARCFPSHTSSLLPGYHRVDGLSEILESVLFPIRFERRLGLCVHHRIEAHLAGGLRFRAEDFLSVTHLLAPLFLR